MSDLPGALRGAIEQMLEGVPRKRLVARARATSEAYRAGKPSSGVIREADDALAYAVTRLPATYAACLAAFGLAARMAPGFRPASVLDAGAGTGAASWAALETWRGIGAVTWLDASPPFLTLAARLAEDGPAVLKDAAVRRGDLTSAGPWPKAELVVASYALAEIEAERQAGVVQTLWEACEGMLALVEPGTPAGYARILAARTALVAAGAHVLAPCPHQDACPLIGSDWCHFSVRLSRSRDHRLAKGAEVPFEDERFAYLVVTRPQVAARPPRPRILAPPRTGKPGIDLKLCNPDGRLELRVVSRREKALYAVARRLGWGDVFDG